MDEQSFAIEEPECLTPSRNTNMLISYCLNVHRNHISPQMLADALTKCTHDVIAAREAFDAQVTEEGLSSQIPDAIQSVIDAFNEYAQALNFTRSWFSNPSIYPLPKAAIFIRDAYMLLNDSLLSYEWAYLGLGAEPHPAINIISKMIAGIKQGITDDERFDEVLGQMWDHFSDCQEDLRNSSDPASARSGLDAVQTILAGIQGMDRYFDNHSMNMLLSGYARFRQGCLLLVEHVQNSVGEALADEPTPSPQVNWLIHAARAALDGLGTDILARALPWFEPQLTESYIRFEQCADSALRGSARMAEQVPVARLGFEKLNRALPLIRLGMDRRSLLPKAISYLEEGAELLYQAWTILTEIEESESTVYCFRCGSQNQATANVCINCGASLIKAIPEPEFVPEVKPSHQTVHPESGGSANLSRLLTACDDVEAGRITQDEFADILDWGRALHADAVKNYDDLNSNNWQEDVMEVIKMLGKGLEDFRISLDELQLFLDDQRPIHLTIGSRLLVKACEQFARVQELSA